MAFKLALSQYAPGLEPRAASYLASLKYFATLTPPVTETLMRTDLETGQFQPFSNDGWDSYMQQLGNLSLDESVLTAAERSIINTIRAVVSPDPSLDCCGAVVPISALTSISGASFARLGSATYEHEMQITLDPTTDCAIKGITVTPVQIGIAPAITSTIPQKCFFKNCQTTGRLYSNLWITFASNPVGESYSLTYDFTDADGIIIYTFAPAYNWDL